MIVLKTLNIITPIGLPGIIKPARKGEMTFSDKYMFEIPRIMQVGMINTKARMIDTKKAHCSIF